MTILVPFLPSTVTNPPFQFQVVLDGANYTASATWNITGQRWYMSITDQSGNNIWTGAIVGSPVGYNIPLAPGVFVASTILYREDTNNFEISP